jgi:hypothetical protein
VGVGVGVCGCVCVCVFDHSLIKTVKHKIENSAQTTMRFSFCQGQS